MTREPFKALFDELRAADEHVDSTLETLDVARTAQRKARTAIWEAIDHAMDAHASARDNDAELKRLILEQGEQIRDLRRRLDNGSDSK